MRTNWLIAYIIILFSSALITFILTFLTKHLKIIDKPGHLRTHLELTPRSGGIGIYIGFLIPVLLSPLLNRLSGLYVDITNTRTILGVLGGAFIVLLIGLYDDIKSASSSRGISAVLKLIILLGTTIILSQGGILLNFPLPDILNFIFTLFWIVGVISAFNAMDNMDGLASGLAIIASATYVVIALQTKQWAWGVLAAALMGANLGFLPHNFRLNKPASIFMGDAGSFFIGFTLATLSIMGGWSTNPLKAAFIPVIILGVPIFDLIYIVIYRHLKGLTKNITEVITYTGHDHLSHRINRFLTRPWTVLFIYFISFTLGLGAIALRNTTKHEAILMFLQYLLLFIIILVLTGFITKTKRT
jgi:UDP-GlcNAc:undecaprenyl-phosphate GlcNAc-1-phosphate transferase